MKGSQRDNNATAKLINSAQVTRSCSRDDGTDVLTTETSHDADDCDDGDKNDMMMNMMMLMLGKMKTPMLAML